MIKIGIIGAMNIEVYKFCKYIKNIKFKRFLNFKIYIGNWDKIKVFLLQTNIGKVNSAISTSLLIKKYKINIIINIGYAGSISKKININDIILSKNTAYYDTNINLIDNCKKYKLNKSNYLNLNIKLIKCFEICMNKIKINYKKGLIISGDYFINSNIFINNIKKLFPNAIAIDMESASISHVCYLFNIPCVIIKSISDIAGNNSDKFFKKNINNIPFNIPEIINIFFTIYIYKNFFYLS
ncbi:5'-methylthioadenosine/adenosylhomocysteine nucleosidase [Candidatus Annandia pinicola]|uniref:5'-methylthioadenosine/adenosylhomocysteine nucleosidase n=1 Tax=Candidatus Annandia pinicola TaxID=1345117 RepID=UPI001D010FF9|nr:5'-methylthioadenosine/adenosylhomocysteine nucleosidase [Candidatus Annandia pinicola]UDG80416.1 5'-methylthioadenosine/S-adenosylhomocysteine nucleosidase [Candidatus Annandia pinicola]